MSLLWPILPSTVTYFQYFDQLWVSTLATTCSRKIRLWLRAALICVYKPEFLEGSLLWFILTEIKVEL